MASSILADLVKNRKKEQAASAPSLISRIDEYLMLRPGEDRRDGFFHPSDISTGFCPRAWCLYNWHPHGLAAKEAAFGSRMQRVLDNGHGLHHRMQRYFQEMGLLWGRYRRPFGYSNAGVTEYEFHFGFPPRLPDGRIDTSWTYAEVKLRNLQRNVLGSTDGLLRLEGHSSHGFQYGKWVLEIKSINDRSYGWLGDGEFGEKTAHRGQVTVYGDALEAERALEKTSWWWGADAWDFWMQPLEGAIILYENKDKQELKEFVVPFRQQDANELFDGIQEGLDVALAYRAAVQSGSPPERFPRCACVDKKTALCAKYPVG